MKKLYIVQIAFSRDNGFSYLPYAAGCLSAAVTADPVLRERYAEPVILFRRESLEKTLSQISDPDTVSFTNYVWNTEYNKKLARLIKEKYPGCRIVFGGHGIAPDSDILETEDYIDAALYGEGELSYPMLLRALDEEKEPSGVPGAMYRKNGKTVRIPAVFADDISDFPSPYLTGVFDGILREYPDTVFHATVETNRGCPYSCAYCEWCFDKKIRPFPMEKVKAEIEWIADHKIEYCFCADGNFGILPRDVDIARWVVDVRSKKGYPQVFKPSYAKNSNENVFKAGRLLYEAGADKGITLSYQTLCPEALKNIGRQNINESVYNELASKYAEMGIPTYSDLILGLPGETYDSFCEGLCRFMECGQHNSVYVYRCQVYANSALGQKDYLEKYKIKTVRAPIDNIHYSVDMGGVEEYFDVITSTYSMSRADWEKMNLFGICTEVFHHLGLLRCFALYLRRSLDVPYYVFYKRLLDWLLSHPETFAGGFLQKLCGIVREPEKQWIYTDEIYGDVCWELGEAFFLECLRHADVFWEEISDFLRLFAIPEEIFPELLSYQRGIIRAAGVNEVKIRSKYDFYSYFCGVYAGKYAELEKKDNVLEIKAETPLDTWADYARAAVWYGRRRGATIFTNSREKITQKYI